MSMNQLVPSSLISAGQSSNPSSQLAVTRYPKEHKVKFQSNRFVAASYLLILNTSGDGWRRNYTAV